MTLVNQVNIPVKLKNRIQLDTKSPAAATSPAVNDFRIATAAIAFIGCTGSGIPKKAPVKML